MATLENFLEELAQGCRLKGKGGRALIPVVLRKPPRGHGIGPVVCQSTLFIQIYEQANVVGLRTPCHNGVTTILWLLNDNGRIVIQERRLTDWFC